MLQIEKLWVKLLQLERNFERCKLSQLDAILQLCVGEDMIIKRIKLEITNMIAYQEFDSEVFKRIVWRFEAKYAKELGL